MIQKPLYVLFDEYNVSLIKAIQDVGLDPLDLVPVQEDNRYVFAFKPSESRMKFTLIQQSNLKRFEVIYTKFTANFDEFWVTNGSNEAIKLVFPDVLARFKTWLLSVVEFDRQIKAPNRWKLLYELKNQSTFTDNNEVFSEEVKQEYRFKLKDFEDKFAQKFELEGESRKKLSALVEELNSKLDKQSIFEWQMFAKGMIVEYIFNTAMNSEMAHLMFDSAISLLKRIPFLPPPMII